MKIDLSGIETDISQDTARRAFYNTSHSPERRGDRVIEDYRATLTELAAYIEGYAQDDRQKAIAQEVFDGLRAKYREKTRNWLAAQSRCLSSMIVGPAKFPVRRAEKANESEHKRAGELIAFSKLMPQYAGKALDRVFTTEEKRDLVLENLKAQLADLEGKQAFMKQANALHRKKDLAGLEAFFKGKYGETGGALWGMATAINAKRGIRAEAHFNGRHFNGDCSMTKRILKKDRLKFEKKDRLKFEKEVNTFFDRICHIKPRRVASDAFEDYRYLKTKYGLDYEIRCVEASDNVYSVMGAFEGGREEYARLREDGIDCNPYTGKWNFHLIDCTAEEAAVHIMRWFKIILPEGWACKA